MLEGPDSNNRIIIPDIFLTAVGGTDDRLTASHIIGFNSSLGTSFETIWDNGGLYPWLTSAVNLNIVSTDANDIFGGSGAQVVRLEGVDADYNLIAEDIQLNGLTIVPSVNQFKCIHEISVPSHYINGDVIPDVSDVVGIITAKNGGTIQAQVINGNNKTLMGIYTIPANYTGYIVHGSAAVGKSKEAHIQLYTREYLGVFALAYNDFMYEGITQRPFVLPHRLKEKTDIDIRAKADQAGVECSANCDILLVRNS